MIQNYTQTVVRFMQPVLSHVQAPKSPVTSREVVRNSAATSVAWKGPHCHLPDGPPGVAGLARRQASTRFAVLVAATVIGATTLQSFAQPLDLEVASRQPQTCWLPPLGDQGRSLWNANLWPGGVVPYEFDANTTVSQQAAMRQSMNALEAAAYLHFVPRSGQGDYLHILNDSGNYTEGVGDYGGFQPVHIYNWNYKFIMCHELMHALGLWHEQSRPDRNQYITVNYGNIQAGWGSQYDIQPGTTPVGAFDFASVMCYGACDASICCPAGSSCSCAPNCWTMTALPQYAQYQNLLGNISHLSVGDVSGLVSRYGAATCPVFTQQPANLTVGYAQAAVFTIAVTGTGTPSYQWRHDGAYLLSDGRITGVHTQSLMIANCGVADAGTYDCIARNSCGSTTSTAATLSVSCAQWTQVATSGPSRRYAQAAFDSARNVAVLFGGYNTGTVFGDTWEWNGLAWTSRSVNGPSARTEFGIGFDSRRAVTVLFSGDSSSAITGDTWEWNGTAWTQRAIAGPPGRYDTAMTYDSARSVMVLYGGIDALSGAVLSDLWEYDGLAWIQRTFTGPGPGGRTFHAVAYDSRRHVTVLFGGSATNAGQSPFGDTWEWDGSGWTHRQPAGLTPPARNRPGLVFDSSRGTTVLFGGATTQSGIGTTGTWEWDGTTWTQRNVNDPPARYLNAMWFDTAQRATTIFGGTLAGTGGTNTDDTWTLYSDPSISVQPADAPGCALGTSAFSVTASGSAHTYQWQVQTAAIPTNSWANLTTGTLSLPCGGSAHATSPNAATTSIGVTPCPGVFSYQVRCVVTNACGSITSNPATLTVCPADFNCDGATDFFDYDNFVTAFESGESSADFDHDGTVDFFDYDAFVIAFETGC